MATSIEHAREHISRIRRSRGLDVDSGENMNAEDLHAALEMLSEQLYQKPTRFIMELIQNADDNHYGSQTPELSLTLSGRHLHIACNETGFTEGNINAISRIHKSTKTNDKSGEGYVGEKGIGFKSVFKVADVVWISSGYYSFKFDKRATLGMVTPIWDAFPVNTRPGYTEFYLQLSEDTDVEGIKKELLSLQPSLLLFLRRLRNINIDAPGHPRISLSCAQTSAGRVLSCNGKSTEYIVHQHPLSNMPREERRPGIASTRILLAFPMNKDHEPIVTDQDVFAFLPIRSYGFKFLIQADFLLVASREDIDQSKQWNTAILEGIVDAFMQVVSPPAHPYLQYQWPRYLPRSIYHHTFLKPLEARILQKVRQSSVLFSSGGTLEAPDRLRRIPSDFLYRNAEPMFSYDHAPYKPLSFRYPIDCLDSLWNIGVCSETSDEFVGRLRQFVQFRASDFRHMEEEWHSRLAEILCSQDRSMLRSSLGTEKIIPLANGDWVSSQGKTIFFGTNQSNVTIPGGLDILTVDPHVANNGLRRSLFAALGVQECGTAQICRAILEKHKRMDSWQSTLSDGEIGTMVEQLKFLFTEGREHFNEDSVWFVTGHGRISRGGQIYLNDPNTCRLMDYFGASSNTVRFLHPAYTERLQSSEKDRFFNWLRDTFKISSIPRLCLSLMSSEMTGEFRTIIQSCSSRQVLTLIRDQWSTYSRFLTSLNPSVHEAVRSMEVACQDGQMCPLHRTYLPLRSLTSKVPVPQAVPFLDVTDPVKWKAFGVLGMKMTDDLEFYLDCLEGLRNKCSERLPLNTLRTLYMNIQCRASDNSLLVKSRFKNEALVYLPPTDQTQNGSWHNSTDCIWRAPKCLGNSRSLQSFYRDHEKLFREILGIRNADIQDVVQKLHSTQMKAEDLEYLKPLLLQLNIYIKRGQTKSDIKSLRDAVIFPTRCGGDESVTLTSAADQSWFIADWSSFRKSFEGQISLLDFPPEQCLGLYPLFEALGMQQKLLSVSIKRKLHLKGDNIPSERFAQILRAKAVHLLRLTPVSEHTRVIKQLNHMEAYEVTAVDVERYVETQGLSADNQTIYGKSTPGDVVLDTAKDTADENIPQIYIAVDCLKPENFPPFQLSTELCRLFHIEDKHVRLVDYILRIGDSTMIEELLDAERIKISKEFENHADEDDEDSEHGGTVFNGNYNPGTEIMPTSNGLPGSGSAPSSMAISLLSALPLSQQSRSQLSNSTYSAPAGAEAQSPAQLQQDEDVAFGGEKFVYELLCAHDENFGSSIWTSHLCERAGHPQFKLNEAEYADFTVPDFGNSLALLVFKQEVPAFPTSGAVTYHIEVKSTTGSRTSSFFMSHRQLQKARKCSFSTNGPLPNHVYVIARVYGVKTGHPQVHFYVDPWRLYAQGDLELKPPQGSYVVTTKI
ncbi:hypothetical protein SLS56_003342 [Neofusicoccum ribis]|uniref:Protein NO VEIN C-terminal domain-containing protein n=1 Tax=Neofusicoccum ribis TaxID=45134 RepID=A0ABR3T0C2_9PEZI